MGLSHYVIILVMDPKQSTGRCSLRSVPFTTTKGFRVSSILCGI